LTKPPGSLGRLEEIAIFMAGWQGRERPRLDSGRAIVFAGNHGIVARGVSAFPASVTAQMVGNFEHGGAAINALSNAAGLDLRVVSIDLDRPTADFTRVPAMSADDCLAAINAGAAAVSGAPDLVVLGEMGIGNSTTAAALCMASFGGSASDWVGPGTGVDTAGLARKVATVEAGLALHRDALATPFETMRRLGGRELAAIAGAVVAARLAGIPVMLDGFICCAAVAPIAAASPDILAHCLAGHVSAEPGHARLLERMGLDPLLSLGMRLGEASGAAVATLLVRAALAAHDGMATFAEAGVAAA
jgi:nicotinate-nucleotide--dimethylbenzimidazole phosphoribosyltransferase